MSNQIEQRFDSAQGALRYLLHLPTADEEKSSWPLIFFLHGRGERGDSLERIKVHGIPRVVEEREGVDEFPFITVSPQCPLPASWEELTDALAALLGDVITRYPVNPARVYLTGMSMGGCGTWKLATELIEQGTTPVAAVVPICGYVPHVPNFVQRVQVLRNTPVWVFHGAKDEVVSVAHSEQLVAALRAVDGDVRYTVYPDAGHDSWTQTYGNPALYEWLLEQTRVPLADPSNS